LNEFIEDTYHEKGINDNVNNARKKVHHHETKINEENRNDNNNKKHISLLKDNVNKKSEKWKLVTLSSNPKKIK